MAKILLKKKESTGNQHTTAKGHREPQRTTKVDDDRNILTMKKKSLIKRHLRGYIFLFTYNQIL